MKSTVQVKGRWSMKAKRYHRYGIRVGCNGRIGWVWGDQRSCFHPWSLHFLTRRLTSWERARVVTRRVSGMSTTIRSSTPSKETRRPDPGTTIPPATCSVKTVHIVRAYSFPSITRKPTKTAVTKNTGLICFGGDQVCE